jgi:hypothetical protein
MAKIAYKKSLIDTNITTLYIGQTLQKKKLMDSVNVQIYKIYICYNFKSCLKSFLMVLHLGCIPIFIKLM